MKWILPFVLLLFFACATSKKSTSSETETKEETQQVPQKMIKAPAKKTYPTAPER